MVGDVTTELLSWSFAPEAVFEGGEAAASVSAMSAEGVRLDFIPASLRRRCSSFSKVTLAVAHAALRGASSGGAVPTVFASAHGESGITRDLLTELAGNQQLSPMGFSLSVHNAASGLYSIATSNTAPSTALAAAGDPFLMGLCETLLLIQDEGWERVLFVCSDDLIPREFLPQGACQPVPYAFAMVLGASGVGVGRENRCRLMLSSEASPDSCPGVAQTPHATSFAHWLRRGEEALVCEGLRSRVRCVVEGEAAASRFVSARG